MTSEEEKAGGEMKRPDIEAIRERILYAREGDIKSAMEIALYDAEDLFAYIEELETRLERDGK